MKRELRVKNPRDFQRIMQRRRFKNSKSFSVYIDTKKEISPRFGISVPKKLGGAVLRNKTKRQVRSMVQEIGVFESDYDYIIMVRKSYFETSFEENRKDLEKLLKTVKI